MSVHLFVVRSITELYVYTNLGQKWLLNQSNNSRVSGKDFRPCGVSIGEYICSKVWHCETRRGNHEEAEVGINTVLESQRRA